MQMMREFPGGPVVRTPCFLCQGLGSIPCWRTKTPPPKPHSTAKKNKTKPERNADDGIKQTSLVQNHKIVSAWASLVAQWLRIYLPMQETRVRALVREDPTCRGAAKPVRHNY